MRRFLDRTGQRFGRLLVLGLAEGDNYRARFNCRCDCGTEVVVRAEHLVSGNTRSCGGHDAHPWWQHRSKIHGRSNTPVYAIWSCMKNRCCNPSYKQWKNYGGRGITISERWLKFENFLADMGDCPPGLTLERIDNDGNYEPSNCKWATHLEQNRNRRCVKTRAFSSADRGNRSQSGAV